ncbi:MAG: hypothetical protein RSB23_05800 [Alistipes sp.]
MKKFIHLLMPLCLLAAVGLTSCDKEESGNNGPQRPSIGTYSYDKVAQNIVYGSFTEDEESYQFIFSPQDATQGQINTYFMVQIKKHFVGKLINTEEVAHNDDYTFVYEDPNHFYSQFKKVFGTIQVVRNSGANFTVQLNFKLADDKPFSANITGTLLALE